MTAPYPLAMIISDAVHRDPATGKYTILGTFSSITSKTYPTVHPYLAVFVNLTDGRGVVPLRMRLVDAEEELEEPLFETEMECDFFDPRIIYEVVMGAKGIAFPHPGEYRLQLFAGEEFLIERRILLLKTEDKK